MRILIDADACPVPVKEILFRASEKRNIALVLVANQYMQTPNSPLIESIRVAAGADEADNHIVEIVEEGELVITADIPLADRAIKKKALVLDPRGQFLTKENIGQRLAMRNFMEEMRNNGENTGGPKAYGQREKQEFASQLDRFLTQLERKTKLNKS